MALKEAVREIIGNPINIRIARLLGKLRVSHLDGGVYYDGEDYSGDLNAMHEAECLKISDENIKTYCMWLERLVDHCFTEGATAAQRAEAFVKTMEHEEETFGGNDERL
jgi:hypothetical protein